MAKLSIYIVNMFLVSSLLMDSAGASSFAGVIRQTEMNQRPLATESLAPAVSLVGRVRMLALQDPRAFVTLLSFLNSPTLFYFAAKSLGGKRESMNFGTDDPDPFDHLDPRALEYHYRDRFEGLKMAMGPARGAGSGKEKAAGRKPVKQSPEEIQNWIDTQLLAAHEAYRRSPMHVVTVDSFLRISGYGRDYGIEVLRYLEDSLWLTRAKIERLQSNQFLLTRKATHRVRYLLQKQKEPIREAVTTARQNPDGYDVLGLLESKDYKAIRDLLRKFMTKHGWDEQEAARQFEVTENSLRGFLDCQVVPGGDLVALLRFCISENPIPFRRMREKALVVLRRVTMRHIRKGKTPEPKFIERISSRASPEIKSFLAGYTKELSDANFTLLARKMRELLHYKAQQSARRSA